MAGDQVVQAVRKGWHVADAFCLPLSVLGGVVSASVGSAAALASTGKRRARSPVAAVPLRPGANAYAIQVPVNGEIGSVTLAVREAQLKVPPCVSLRKG